MSLCVFTRMEQIERLTSNYSIKQKLGEIFLLNFTFLAIILSLLPLTINLVGIRLIQQMVKIFEAVGMRLRHL